MQICTNLPIFCTSYVQMYSSNMFFFTKFPLAFATFGNVDNRSITFPVDAASRANGVRKTQKEPTN